MSNYPTGGRRSRRASTNYAAVLRPMSDEAVLRYEAQAEANATGTTVAGFDPKFRGFPKAAAKAKAAAEAARSEMRRRGLSARTEEAR